MLINHLNHKIISKKERLCRNIFSQARGLIFRKRQNIVMIFQKEKRISLHMFFVFYPIDVLILNKNKKIVEIKRNFKPFRFWNSKEKGMYIVELAYPSQYQVNDLLELKV
ncbi:MAG: DUF192 domain-containing protein [Nanoarchaeota archaeon]|nr:DUF192 domain-containing protein [Nanoarchaeota archaeon]MBU1622819.1 DUF192 domain-containing protein [Nanoarchaeota archaeon]MBU1974320.1 DUF192 domain-containing protein [Nanoarchaeota archaeon]